MGSRRHNCHKHLSTQLLLALLSDSTIAHPLHFPVSANDSQVQTKHQFSIEVRYHMTSTGFRCITPQTMNCISVADHVRAHVTRHGKRHGARHGNVTIHHDTRHGTRGVTARSPRAAGTNCPGRKHARRSAARRRPKRGRPAGRRAAAGPIRSHLSPSNGVARSHTDISATPSVAMGAEVMRGTGGRESATRQRRGAPESRTHVRTSLYM